MKTRSIVARTLRWLPTLTAVLALGNGCRAEPADAGTGSDERLLYVAPNGNDSWSGRLPQPAPDRSDGPLATLAGARDAVRRNRTPTPSRPTRVIIADGTYALSEPIQFGPADSGQPEAPVRYEAARGARPLFTGGRRITGWKVDAAGVWRAELPEVREGRWYFEQLWVNGRRATRARSPNQGYFFFQRRVGRGLDPATGQPADLSRRTLRGEPEDLAPLSGIPTNQLADVTVVVYHSWEVSRHRVLRYDDEAKLIYLTGDANRPFFQFGPIQRYHLENYRQALDEPGEWHLDREGVLLYRPLAGETIADCEAWAPATEQFLMLNGDHDRGVFVENLEFRGLRFAHGQYLLPQAGMAAGQAAQTIPAVIQAWGTRLVTFEDCEISHVGLSGIWFRRGCYSNRVERCHLQDLGASGIRIGETWEVQNPLLTKSTHRNVIDNCIIHGGGRIHLNAVGIWIGASPDNQITHNDISDFYQAGVSAGWRWGYEPSAAKRNQIESNHIHHLGWGVLSDIGAIYTLGPSEGTAIRFNRLHDIRSYDAYGRGGFGIYNDEGSSGVLIENNLVYQTATGGYHLHYGHTNLVRNNIFALSAGAELQRTKAEDQPALTFEHNIVLGRGDDLLAGVWLDRNVLLRSNLWWRMDRKPLKLAGLPFSEWQRGGRDQGSITTDPKFANPERSDFSLGADSPSRRIGFRAFDTTQAGVYGDAAWRQLAAQLTYPNWGATARAALARPRPFSLKEDFDWQPVGDTAISVAKVFVEGQGDGIAISDDTAASGKRSVKFTDAAGLSKAYDPHLVFNLDYASGVAVCRFALRFEAETDFLHQWRDAAQPYRVGPSVRITNGLLTAGRERLNLPSRQWIRFEVQSQLGTASNGKWNLVVRLPNGTTRRFSGLACQPEWKTLNWLGFAAMNDGPGLFYLDDLEIENTPP